MRMDATPHYGFILCILHKDGAAKVRFRCQLAVW